MVFNTIKNLILVVHNKRYAPSDFIDIRDRIAARAPDIRAFVVGARIPANEFPAPAWRDATLTVALSPDSLFKPLRGRFIFNRKIGKLEQMEMLRSAGIVVPRSEIFQPGMTLDAAVWGEHVMLKPAPLEISSHGDGIQLYRRARLAAMTLADFPKKHLVHTTPMIVQPFIDTGLYPSKYRALVFCGEVLYVQYTVLDEARPELTAADDVLEAAMVSTGGGERRYYHENYQDVAAFAKLAATAFPDVPLLGIDVIRDAATGLLYVLEINAGGNVWHFSSPMWAERRVRFPDVVKRMHEQYGAFDTAARALIAATRRLAI